ncbi:hypothetical protein Taro_037111 [Colocasia esculenta]|uniref:Uncharacterized protein n=1 Tax=Colocasia esculenta TaxID=4460 RepID=A0A843WJT7_COLES|nr:hypothetical protein [Colocasia esculenta]
MGHTPAPKPARPLDLMTIGITGPSLSAVLQKHKKYKKKVMTVACDNEEVSSSDLSSSDSEKDQDSLRASGIKDA